MQAEYKIFKLKSTAKGDLNKITHDITVTNKENGAEMTFEFFGYIRTKYDLWHVFDNYITDVINRKQYDSFDEFRVQFDFKDLESAKKTYEECIYKEKQLAKIGKFDKYNLIEMQSEFL